MPAVRIGAYASLKGYGIQYPPVPDFPHLTVSVSQLPTAILSVRGRVHVKGSRAAWAALEGK